MLAGNIPLLLLARSVSLNLLNTRAFERMVLRSVRGSKPTPIGWSLADADGNTALHLLFDIEAAEESKRRYGKPVQTFARTLASLKPQQRHLLSQMDLLATNNDGESVMQLIAEHCLRPRSRRSCEFGYWGWNWHTEDYSTEEKHPDTRNTAEQLYSAWMRERIPVIRSVTAALLQVTRGRAH